MHRGGETSTICKYNFFNVGILHRFVLNELEHSKFITIIIIDQQIPHTTGSRNRKNMETEKHKNYLSNIRVVIKLVDNFSFN